MNGAEAERESKKFNSGNLKTESCATLDARDLNGAGNISIRSRVAETGEVRLCYSKRSLRSPAK